MIVIMIFLNTLLRELKIKYVFGGEVDQENQQVIEGTCAGCWHKDLMKYSDDTQKTLANQATRDEEERSHSRESKL